MHPLQRLLCGRCGDYVLSPERDGDIVSWTCRCGWHAETRLPVAACSSPDAPPIDRRAYARYLAVCLTRQEYLLPPSASEVDQLLFQRWRVTHKRHPEYVGVERWSTAR